MKGNWYQPLEQKSIGQKINGEEKHLLNLYSSKERKEAIKKETTLKLTHVRLDGGLFIHRFTRTSLWRIVFSRLKILRDEMKKKKRG